MFRQAPISMALQLWASITVCCLRLGVSQGFSGHSSAGEFTSQPASIDGPFLLRQLSHWQRSACYFSLKRPRVQSRADLYAMIGCCEYEALADSVSRAVTPYPRAR